jgi:hypothetical protein
MKKVWIGIVTLIILIIVVISWYWLNNTQNVRSKVLEQLEQKLEFCKIVKDKINIFSTTGEFWMICNDRPFYARYEDGSISYELNGWSFLNDQPEVLNEIERDGCNFFNSIGNSLIFVCKDKAKVYNFSISNFRLTKSYETPFVNEFLKFKKYGCLILGYSLFGIQNEKFLEIKMKCKEHNVSMFFNLEKLYFTPPLVTDEDISNKERANLSFQLIGKCKLDYIQEMPNDIGVIVGMDCNIGKPKIVYNFVLETSNFLFDESEFATLFPYLSEHVFPFLEVNKMEHIKSEENNTTKLEYYLAGSKVIIARSEKGSGIVSEVYLKNEGLL